jgi:hypothetical protein
MNQPPQELHQAERGTIDAESRVPTGMASVPRCRYTTGRRQALVGGALRRHYAPTTDLKRVAFGRRPPDRPATIAAILIGAQRAD